MLSRPSIVEERDWQQSGMKNGLAFSSHPRASAWNACFLQLNDEERIDLLALGWLGQGNSGTEWQPIFDRACIMIDGYANDEWRYVLHLGVHWRAGFKRLTGITI